MRWRGRRQSTNIEDRRGMRRVGGRRAAGGGAALILILAGLFFGEDVSRILGLFLGNSSNNTQVVQQPRQSSAQEEEFKKFALTILAETEDTWNAVFARMGKQYQPPKLVLYNDMVQSACGVNSAAAGPFYCPGDYRIYIDLSFLRELKKMGAPGDFAFAYVIAHEVGHHVQNLVGIADQVRQQQARSSKVQSNQLSVKMELQADCLAGVWINHTEGRNAILEPGDIEEGLDAAAAVGDDQIMRKAGHAPRREMFTHGSSAERQHWFAQGVKTGSIQTCNTFD